MLMPVLLFLVLIAVGCSVNFTLKDPGFDRPGSPDNSDIQVALIDARCDSSSVGLTAMSRLKNMDMHVRGFEDPCAFLTASLNSWWGKQDKKISCHVFSGKVRESPFLLVYQFRLICHQSFAGSPFESYLVFSGDLVLKNRTVPIRAFQFATDGAVYQLEELEEPCINRPSSWIVSEIAAKISRQIADESAPDSLVQTIAHRVRCSHTQTQDSCLADIYRLGFSGNKSALPVLRQIAVTDCDRIVAAHAVSMYGYLAKKECSLDSLALYSKKLDGSYTSYYIKALGETGLSTAFDTIKFIKNKHVYKKERSVRFCADLYEDVSSCRN
jgi:hypothetical protein